MIKSSVCVSRKKEENHVEIIIKTKNENEGEKIKNELKKVAHDLSHKMRRKLSYEIISITQNTF